MENISRYGVFCKVAEQKNFTKVANEIGYSQSAVSQIVKSLERELGCCLIERRKDGIRLTPDGEEYYPYIQGMLVFVIFSFRNAYFFLSGDDGITVILNPKR